MFPPPEQLTAQKYDATVGVNVVGHHLFLRLLYPLLASPHPTSLPGPARVVWVSSCANYLVPGRLDFSTFTDGPARQPEKVDTFGMYCQSKLAQIQASALVARRAADAGEDVVSIAVDPGHIRSDIFRSTTSFFYKLWVGPILYRWAGSLLSCRPNVRICRTCSLLIPCRTARSPRSTPGPCRRHSRTMARCERALAYRSSVYSPESFLVCFG